MKLYPLDPFSPNQAFPNPENALKDPDGLLAIGGCLTAERIINAYTHGIFPWYNPCEPILWWSPNPRLVLYPEKFKASRSLAKKMRKNMFEASFDRAFAEVIEACAEPREADGGTWITDEMMQAYINLHQLGKAHSIEVWQDQTLVGGLYGIAIGRVFFGESMFHKATDASKIAFAFLVEHLKKWGYQLIDCQVHSHHLVSLGAEQIERSRFLHLLQDHCRQNASQEAWRTT